MKKDNDNWYGIIVVIILSSIFIGGFIFAYDPIPSRLIIQCEAELARDQHCKIIAVIDEH